MIYFFSIAAPPHIRMVHRSLRPQNGALNKMEIYPRHVFILKIFVIAYAFIFQLRLRNPDFPKNEGLWRYKNFSGVSVERRESHETSATLQREAHVDEESWHNAM